MKQKYSPKQIVKFLRDTEGKLASGKTVEEVCREPGGPGRLSHYVPHRWLLSCPHHRHDRRRRGLAPLDQMHIATKQTFGRTVRQVHCPSRLILATQLQGLAHRAAASLIQAADSIPDAGGPFISGALPLKPRHFAPSASSMISVLRTPDP